MFLHWLTENKITSENLLDGTKDNKKRIQKLKTNKILKVL